MKLKPRLLSRAAALAAVVALVSACSSTVTHQSPGTGAQSAAASTPPPALTNVRVGKLDVTVTEEGRESVAENPVFEINRFREAVAKVLTERGLMGDPNGADQITIQITGVYARSNGAAIWAGFMAGSDKVNGLVTLKRADGQVAREFKVEASYSLGGLGGGWSETRMGWLYDRFANDTADAIVGPRK